MKTKPNRKSIVARIRESWWKSGLRRGMPYADYPFKAVTPPR